MTAIVNLRDMSDEKIEELVEDARKAMYNLRFRHASSRLDDVSQIRITRREIARYETVLRMRDLAINTAAQQPEITAALKDREWYGEARFDYHESAWKVEFLDQDGDKEIATALVDLNQKKSTGGSRKDRRSRKLKADTERSPVINFEVAG